VGAGANIAASGAGTIALTTATNIFLDANSFLTTESGSIALSANQQSPASPGDFVGISLSGATVKSASGSITLLGRGGNGLLPQIGVYLQNAALVGDLTAGDVTITGRGGTTPL